MPCVPSASPQRCTLKEAILLIRISKAKFYKIYRRADVRGDHAPATAGALRDHYTLALDIRVISVSGREQLSLSRDAVLALRARIDARELGPLAFGRSLRAARFGMCAKRGFESRVRKDGSPREARARAYR